jgi:hypothetical protein
LSWILSLSLVRCHLDGKRMSSPEPTVPLTAAGADEIGPSGLPSFKQELLALVHFMSEYILVTPLGNQLLQARQA